MKQNEKKMLKLFKNQLKMVHRISIQEIEKSLNQDFFGMELDYGLYYRPVEYVSGDYLKLFRLDDTYILLFCDASGHGIDSREVSNKLVHYSETYYEKYLPQFKKINAMDISDHDKFNHKVKVFYSYINGVSNEMEKMLDMFGDEYFVAALFVFIQKVDDEFHLFFMNRGTLWPIIYRKVFENLDSIHDYNDEDAGVRGGDLIGSSFLIETKKEILKKRFKRHFEGDLNLTEKRLDELVIKELAPVNHFKMYLEDQIVFFTDGITEAVNENYEEYGIDRVRSFFSRKDIWDLPAQKAVNLFINNLISFCGTDKLMDDATLLLLRFKNR